MLLSKQGNSQIIYHTTITLIYMMVEELQNIQEVKIAGKLQLV